jgi:hypothetical protein
MASRAHSAIVHSYAPQRVLFLIALKTLHCSTTGRTGSLYSMPAIFHCHLLRVLYLGLLFALYTVRLSHFELLSSLQQSCRYVLHYASQGVSSARFLLTYTCWGNASDTPLSLGRAYHL